MARPALSTLLAGGIGIALLVASLAALGPFATLGSTTYTYEAQPVTDPGSAERVLIDHDDVLDCGIDRACGFERPHVDGETTTIETGELRSGPYAVVLARSPGDRPTAYRPVDTRTDGGIEAGLEQITLSEAVESVTTDRRPPREQVRAVVAEGRVTTTDRLYDDFGPHLVAVDGTVYRVERVDFSRPSLDPHGALRLRDGIALAGLVLVGTSSVWLRDDLADP